MKIILKLALMTLITLSLVACSKNKEQYPSINFIGGNNLTSRDAIFKPNETFKIGINSFTRSDSPLYKFKVTRIYENAPYVVIDSIIDVKNFNTIMTLPSAEKEATERWIFTMSCADGYTSEISMFIQTSDTLTTINKISDYSRQYIIADFSNKNNNIIFYIAFGVVLILAFIVYLIIRKNKKEYNVVDVDKMKDELEIIKNHINKQVDKYESQIKDYQNEIEKLKGDDKISWEKLALIIGGSILFIFILTIVAINNLYFLF
jgi:succinate dehydrogenase/fumarate reductase-like Fe-S protein